MKKKILLSIMLLFTICFSVFGFAGCDSREGAPTLEVDISKVSYVREQSGEKILRVFEKSIYDIDDVDGNKSINDIDISSHKNKLLKGIVITYKYIDKDGEPKTETFNSYQEFINAGGNVSGFNYYDKETDKNKYYVMTFSYKLAKPFEVKYVIDYYTWGDIVEDGSKLFDEQNNDLDESYDGGNKGNDIFGNR